MHVKDFTWKPNMTVNELVDSFGNLGYQAIELSEAAKVVLKMKKSLNNISESDCIDYIKEVVYNKKDNNITLNVYNNSFVLKLRQDYVFSGDLFDLLLLRLAGKMDKFDVGFKVSMSSSDKKIKYYKIQINNFKYINELQYIVHDFLEKNDLLLPLEYQQR